jgi:hypothetical protein
MMTRSGLLLSLLLACAALPSGLARAQAAADTTCTYSRCALRVDHGFFSTRLVRGASGESVSRLGWFGSGIDLLLAGSDSTAHHARLYRSRRSTADALGLIGAALAIGGFVQGDDFANSGPLLLAAITLDLAALPFWIGSRRSLDRAVWWYNRDLPRP